MDETDIEKAFDQLKNEIPTNQDLKYSLRREFTRRKKTRVMKNVYLSVIAAAVACFAFVTYLLTPGTVIEKAAAASLRIYNQVSFLDIGGGSSVGVSESKGTVYLPIFGKGLYGYDTYGFHRLVDKDVSSVRVSHDGKRLAISADGSISIFNVETKKSIMILEGDKNNNISYEEPSWSPDDSLLIFTQKQYNARSTHGFTETDSVCQINLRDNTVTKLAEGSHPSYTAGTGLIVFEREQKVISKDLKTGQEKTIDSGRFPMVSPDGSYVAYVKTEHRERDVAANAKVGEDVDDVWIVDAVDYQTKKRVTSNYPFEFTQVSQWLDGLKSSSVPQILSFSGMYSYYEPVWSSDSNSLYVLKDKNDQAGGGMRLTRIDFTTEKQNSRDTVKRFLQALVMRDDDYAKSLMKSPPDILTVSNPHQVGYKILNSSQKNGRDYVEAEFYSASTASPDYFVTKARFYLSPGENGYIIDKMERLEDTSVSASSGENAVYMTKNSKRELLFKDSDMPAEFVTQGDHRVASLAYNPETDTLAFTVQVLQDEKIQQKSSVKIFSYNLSTKEFKLIDHVTRLNDKLNTGVAKLIFDNSGRYIALDLFSDDDKTYTSYGYVYDVQDNDRTDLAGFWRDTDIGGVHTNYWNEGRLIYNLSSQDQYMGYSYDPGEEAVHSFTEK